MHKILIYFVLFKKYILLDQQIDQQRHSVRGKENNGIFSQLIVSRYYLRPSLAHSIVINSAEVYIINKKSFFHLYASSGLSHQ